MRTTGFDDPRISISQIKHLPAVPMVLTRILGLVEDKNSTIQDLEQAILSDQGITTKVLRVANSAFYGFPGKITTVSKAIIIIGFSSVKDIAVGVSVFDAFRPGNRKGAEEMKAGWLHALEVAYCCKVLATRFGGGNGEEAFVSGLLHDVGKAAFIYLNYEQYRCVLERVAAERQFESHLVAERELLGITHTEIGEALGEAWRLPKPFINCISLHHSPNPVQYSELVQIVSLSNRLAQESIPAEQVTLPTYFSNLSLSGQDVDRLRDYMKRYAHEMQSSFKGA